MDKTSSWLPPILIFSSFWHRAYGKPSRGGFCFPVRAELTHRINTSLHQDDPGAHSQFPTGAGAQTGALGQQRAPGEKVGRMLRAWRSSALRHEQTSFTTVQMKWPQALVEEVTERLRKPLNPCAEQFSYNYFVFYFCSNSVWRCFLDVGSTQQKPEGFQ